MKTKKITVLFIILSLSIAICTCENPIMQSILQTRIITFDSKGGSHVSSQTLFKNEKISRPKNPSKSGFTFNGWFKDDISFNYEWNFNDIPEGDMTLYAKWKYNGDTIIVINSVALNIESPNKNEIPSSSATGYGHFTISTVSWSPYDNPFKGGAIYTASVTLTADTGYTFNGLYSATVNGYDAVISENTGTTVKISYIFAPTLNNEITGILIKYQPSKLSYTEGEPLDLSGLVVTLIYNTGSTQDVTFYDFYVYNISANPWHWETLTLAHNGNPVIVSSGGYSAPTNNLTVIAAAVPVTGVSLEQTTLTLTAGGTATLTATVEPYNASSKNVMWSSNNNNVATVNNGVVIAHTAGTATITVTTANGGFTATCAVTVQTATVPVTGVFLDRSSLTLTAGDTATLTATVEPSNATSKNVTWSSNNNGVVTVDNGMVTAHAVGTAIIIATSAEGGKTAECAVTVQPVSVTDVSLNPSTLTLTVGDSSTLTASIEPTNATNKSISWSTNNANIATVNNGTVTAVAVGTAVITVTTADGNKTATCTVTVQPVSVTSVSLDPSTLTLTVGGSATLTATVSPNNATNKDVTWSSNNANIATVNNGTVNAVAAGIATITVTTADGGKTATCSVTVETLPSLSIEMVSIPAGTFMMGSPENETDTLSIEHPQHSVTLSAFSMSKYQVTQEQYQSVMGTNPSFFDGSKTREPADVEIQSKRPVERVSWYDAIVFCNKLSEKDGLTPAYSISGSTDPEYWGTVPRASNTTWDVVVIVASSTGYRLPTEAQWEYACCAGTTTAYNTGDTFNDDTGWYGDNSDQKTHQVGLKPANAWGLYDMHGNLNEWCWDWYDSIYYSSSPANNPIGASSGTLRVARGGCYSIPSVRYLRSAVRNYLEPYQTPINYGGLRLVRP